MQRAVLHDVLNGLVTSDIRLHPGLLRGWQRLLHPRHQLPQVLLDLGVVSQQRLQLQLPHRHQTPPDPIRILSLSHQRGMTIKLGLDRGVLG